jgi:hypothetical protein
MVGKLGEKSAKKSKRIIVWTEDDEKGEHKPDDVTNKNISTTKKYRLAGRLFLLLLRDSSQFSSLSFLN